MAGLGETLVDTRLKVWSHVVVEVGPRMISMALYLIDVALGIGVVGAIVVGANDRRIC